MPRSTSILSVYQVHILSRNEEEGIAEKFSVSVFIRLNSPQNYYEQ